MEESTTPSTTTYKERRKKREDRQKKLIVRIVTGVGLLFLLLSCFATVGAGTVGVITRFGRVTGRVLEPGAHFVWPIEGVKRYNTKKITYETAEPVKQKTSKADYKDFPVETTTKDGQGVKVTYTIRFRVDPTKATWLANNIGSEKAIVEKVVKTDSRAWTRTIIRDFVSTDLYSGNIRQVQEQIFDTLTPMFEANGLLLDEFVLREPRFAEEYEAVMESKQRELEQVEVERHKAEQEKHKKEARITAAEAAAKEQELQRTTISTQLLEKMWIEKWNGNLPVYMLGDGEGIMLQLP